VSATVVALGGNALVREGESGTVAEQRANLREHCAALVPLLDGPLVVTHGNGPQVGAALLRSERAADEAPPLPLWLAVAQTQAEIGSLIGLELGALTDRAVAALVTHVRVDEDDPAFAEPTKPIGPFYSREQAERLEGERGWRLAEDAGRGWRRVVPSPRPRAVVELEAVRRLLDDGVVAVACGGGGIPVVERSGRLDGVDAVIDKDLAAQRLASALGVEALALVTSVPAVQLGHGTPRQHDLHQLAVDDAERYLAEGQFAAGSMGPKVAAAIRFIREGGEAVAITTPALLASTMAASDGRPAGTLVTAASGRRVSP
jgi:carbamate kinase